MGAGQALSAAALDKKLSLRKRARDDAALDLPSQDAETLSAAELAVLAAAGAERARVENERRQTGAETERLARALRPAPQDFFGPAIDARLALKQAAGRLEHDWTAAAAAAAQARKDLEAFKRTHDLRRAAVYPASALLQAGLLFCAALFEALFSAALFAEDDARGFLGGAITAIGLSGANVTLGFLSGYLGLRYLQHARWPWKTAGAFGFAALALLALMLNLFAADWRDRLAVLAGRQTDLGSDAGFHLWSLLQLQSPQAIILLMLGVGVWVFAALKGYSGFDDPYPEFGMMDRAAKNAAETLSDFRAEARLELEAPVDAARAALAERLEKMRADYDAMSKAFDAGAAAIQSLDQETRAIDEAAQAAVTLYREENATRRRSPAPGYFADTPQLPEPAVDALASAALMIEEARAQLKEAHAQSAQALEALLQELEQAAARLDAGGGS